MKAITCKKYGSTEVLQVDSLPKPKPKKNEVLIEVHAASVNPVDWKIRRGQLIIKTGVKPPHILGSDFAGTVQAIGSQVNYLQVGDQVWGKFDSFKGGSYAQWVTAKAQELSLKPDNIDWFGAASIPNVALTAYQAMVVISGLQAGQRVMINGASGGVGLMAVQIAKTMKCHVTAVCSRKNVALLESLGADVVLDYRKEDILTTSKTYDVFFDCVANQSFFKVRKTLKAGGVHIKTTPDFMSLLGQLVKPFNIKRPDHVMVKPNHQHLLQLKQWVENKQLKPIVQQVLPMTEVARAHQISEAGHVVGKLVLGMQTGQRKNQAD